MEQEKPFKTIEVVDSRTNQTCKVACMSCIRGHRTTSCGIPVCRTKIFWTVKRPGRPSNSCTCRYGATGGCKCVVARSACPHKSKKGEKRSGECRCDEQGRYCCLIEPDHWTALLSLQKPVVEFFSTREELEAKQKSPLNMSLPQTPAYSSIASPPQSNSVPSTPAPQGRMQPIHIMPNAYNSYVPAMQSTTLTPRFGMMGIGAPMGDTHNPPDQLVWEGQAPLAPRELHPQPVYEEQGSCCQGSTPSAQSVMSPTPSFEPTFSQHQPLGDPNGLQPFSNGAHDTVSLPQISPAAPAFNFDKLQTDYFNYQFPSAICQNCGLNGCTCRNCPPVFQNFGTTSWAQCCGRKHARDVQPAPPEPSKMARTEKYDPSQGLHAHPPPATTMQNFDPSDEFAQALAFDTNSGPAFGEGFEEMDLPPIAPSFDDFDIPPDLMLNGHDPLDLNEFLMSDLDRINHSTVNSPAEVQPSPGGGGGCCCSGD